MALADIVSISISSETAAVTQAGFGTPLILAADCPAGFTERVRTYTSLKGLSDDGFSTSGATYLMASKVFAQSPRVTRLKVGRMANKPTQRWAITPVAANSTVYKLTIDGTEVSYTSDASATVTEIITGLKAAIDALSLAVTVSDQTTYMRILANTAGAFHKVSVADLSLLGIAQDHADPGHSADLTAISAEDDDWYGLLMAFPSSACVLALAAIVEAQKKIYVAQTQDSAVVTVSSGSDTTSVAHGLLAYARSALIYSESGENFADAALMGKCLPLDPGSETWKFKTLATVPASVLTATRRTNALAKSVNTYSRVAGINITENGTMGIGEFIDVIRFRDWLEARIQEGVFGALARAKKIPFTDDGISVVEGIVRATLNAGIAAGGLASSPAPVVTVPKAADVSDNDKAARSLTGVAFSATLAGAIHAVTINGNVSV